MVDSITRGNPQTQPHLLCQGINGAMINTMSLGDEGPDMGSCQLKRKIYSCFGRIVKEQ